LSRLRKNAYKNDNKLIDYNTITIDDGKSPKYCGISTINKTTPNGVTCGNSYICSKDGECQKMKSNIDSFGLDILDTLIDYNGSNIKIPEDKCGRLYGKQRCPNNEFCSNWNNCGLTEMHKKNSQIEYNGPTASFEGYCGTQYGSSYCDELKPCCDDNGKCVTTKPIKSSQSSFDFIMKNNVDSEHITIQETREYDQEQTK
jgi:hypothetical protein